MVYVINILLVLIQVSSCQDKTDLEIVTFCPTSKEERDRAAQKKNCSTFVALDANEEQYEYHCLVNAYLNETLEVCAPKKWIFGYCTEFNVAGRFIQNHEEAKCNENYPRCDQAYSSADAYKYPDCYQIVYDKRKKDYTTYLPPKKTTLIQSKDIEDNGNTGVTAVAIYVVVIVIMFIVISVILCIKKKRTGKKKKELDEEEGIHLTDTEAANAIHEGEGSIRYFHFKVKNFKHFSYIYPLIRKITQNNVWWNEMQLEDIIIKIGVAGTCNKDNLNLFPKGKTNLNCEKQNVWPAVPVLCFQNNLSVESAVEILRQNMASYSILVSSKPISETDNRDNSIIIIGPTKDEIMKTITVCLEQPFRHMLEQLLKDLSTKDSSRLASKRSGEIEALLKEMTFDNNEETIKEHIPEELQDYLSRSDGFEQAKLSPYSLDILVDKKTDKKLMKDDMTKLNPSFLKRFPLTIQRGTMIKQNTGGFVKATDNGKKKNNFTCGHVVPKENKGNKVLYTKVRNAPKNYKSDNEHENETPTDVKDSLGQKTEKNTVDSPSLNTAVSTKKDTKLYGPRYLDFCLVEVLLLFGLLLSFKHLWNSDGIIEEPLD